MRFDDWPELLNAYVARHKDTPFEWGLHDCWQWAMRWVEECTGRHPAPDLIAAYVSPLGARRIIHKRTGRHDMAILVDQHLGKRQLPGYAARGDIAMVPDPLGLFDGCLGVFLGQQIAVPGEHGLLIRPWQELTASWRVV